MALTNGPVASEGRRRLGAAVICRRRGAADAGVVWTKDLAPGRGQSSHIEQFRMAVSVDGAAGLLLSESFGAGALDPRAQVGEEPGLDFLEPLLGGGGPGRAVLARERLDSERSVAQVDLPSGRILFLQENRAQFDNRARFEPDCGIDAIGGAASRRRHNQARLARRALPMADNESRHDLSGLWLDDG